MDRVRRVLSFSNVVACLALFIALGGTVYAAGKMDGRAIERGSLPGNRLEPKTITARRVKPKTLTGRQVKPGSLTGKQINQKSLNKIIAAGLAGLRYEAVTVPLPTGGRPATTATANCPAGTYVIGGGATVSDDGEATVNDSGPTVLRTGWTATAFAWYSASNTMTVTAICVVVEKPGGAETTLPRGDPPPNPPIEYKPVG